MISSVSAYPAGNLKCKPGSWGSSVLMVGVMSPAEDAKERVGVREK